MKLYKYLPVLLLAAFASSCEVERLPLSEISEDEYYTTADELATGLVACYNGLQDPLEYEWRLTELRSDHSRIETSGSTKAETFLQLELDRCLVPTTNSHVYDYWKETYYNITNCNTILDNIDVVENEATYNEIAGQARFIRAYHYFNLVRLYGPVFLVKTRISAQESLEYTRAPLDECYEFIVEELIGAAEMLEGIVFDSTEFGRATEWAAKSLLGKVYLTLYEYSNAAEVLLDVINNSGHELLSSYADVHSIYNEGHAEAIFSVRFTSGGLDLGSSFANMFMASGGSSSADVITGGGDGYNIPTYCIRNAYEDGDLRGEDVTFKAGYYNAAGTSYFEYPYCYKYFELLTIADDGDSDWIVLRYADVLLMYAEACNELDQMATAVEYMNMTRVRAGLTEVSEADYSSKNEMRMALETERQVELAFENHRWFDLVRTGRVIEVVMDGFSDAFYSSAISAGNDLSMPSYDGSGSEPMEENDILLPIPQTEIDANPNITQNAGY
ncbi:MAG: RagB/SusD family nutrient uptake outer membrane protein [Rikenellaceae bacterium]